MLWLYVHFPHLLLDHLRAHRSDEAPLVVAGSNGALVEQACPQAQAQGITPGMRLKTAISLAPELVPVEPDPEQADRVLEQQARWLYRYAARITLYPPDGLLAEASSLERLYGSAAAFWRSVAQALDERGLTYQIALGLTPLAARLCARQGTGERTASEPHLKALIAALPLHALELDATTEKRLKRLGLSTLSEVQQLPPAEVARRLTPETLTHIQRLQGERPDPQTPWEPPHRFREQVDFLREVEQNQGLLFPLQRILEELETDLRWRQEDTDTLSLVLRHPHHAPTRLRIRTAGPEHRAGAFLELIRLRLDQQPLSAPVSSLVLVVRRFLSRQVGSSTDLLGDGEDRAEAWQTLVSRLQARLGDQALHRLSPHADHRPERAWTITGMRSDTMTPRPVSPPRPLWLLRQPRPLSHTPTDWFSGPERISGGWWDGERVLRDYYVARLGTGQLAWVFRDVRAGWFIHGWYG